MADKKTSTNVVEIEGYLKENTLAQTTTKTGKEAIMGTLTIALSDREDYRIRFMAMKTNSSGEENPTYKNLTKLLPINTITIATLLKANPQATFDEVKLQATQAYAKGAFELYDRKNEDGKVLSSVTIRGTHAGLKTTTSKQPFSPKADFKVEAVLLSKKEEIREGEVSTGRTIIRLMVPDHYRKVGMPMEMVCVSDSANETVASLYERGDCGQFAGSLCNSREDSVVTTKRATYTDGTCDEVTRVTTTFINERRVQKVTNPYSEGEAGYISLETMNEYMTNYEAKIAELEVTPAKDTQTQAQTPAGIPQSGASEPKKFTF